MAQRKTFSDTFIRSRKPAPVGTRAEYQDGDCSQLWLRVTDSGHKSFVYRGRFPKNPNVYTRRALGTYPEMTIAEARDEAGKWKRLIGQGTDPEWERQQRRALEQRKRLNSFAAVATEFLDRHASGLAKAGEAKRIIDAEFVKRWGARPAADILPEEAAEAIRAIVRRGSPYQAHNAFGYLRRLYNWAIGTHEFGLIASPVASLRPSDLIGKRETRDRILTDHELRAVWKAAAEMGFPYGPVFRLLILTGQREREVADLQRHEIDRSARLWTIPATRMKGNRTHEVPLAPDAYALLDALPSFSGEYLFTTTAGEKPINGFSKAKARIDKLSGVTGWKIHDLRRTMRTHLSALPIDDNVRELMIAHAKKGLHKVYDLHAYQEEKRRGFGLWEKRLARIVKPIDAEVISFGPLERSVGRVNA